METNSAIDLRSAASSPAATSAALTAGVRDGVGAAAPAAGVGDGVGVGFGAGAGFLASEGASPAAARAATAAPAAPVGTSATYRNRRRHPGRLSRRSCRSLRRPDPSATATELWSEIAPDLKEDWTIPYAAFFLGLTRNLTAVGADLSPLPPAGLSPLIRQMLADYAATGLPPAYLPSPHQEPNA